MCSDRLEGICLQRQESEVGRLKRLLEIEREKNKKLAAQLESERPISEARREELAAWRWAFDGYTYHPKSKMFTGNG